MGGRGAYAARRKAGRSRTRGRPKGGGRAAPSTPVIPSDEDGGGSVKPSPGPGSDGESTTPPNPQPAEPARPGGGGPTEPPGGGSGGDTGTPDPDDVGGTPGEGDAPADDGPSWLDPINLKLEPGHSTPAQIAADLAAANPDYDRFNKATSENCQRCVVAYDMRARDYDVEAQAVPQVILDNAGDPDIDDRDSGQILARYSHRGVSLESSGGSLMAVRDGQILGMSEYSPDPGNVPPRRKWGFLPRGSILSRKAVESAVKAWGPGSRGFVAVQWKRGSGHVFIVENDNGKVVYRDPQVNSKDASYHWDNVKQSEYTNALLRVDDLTPNEKIATWIKNSDGS